MSTIFIIILLVLLAGAVFILKKALDAKQYLESEVEELQRDSNQYQIELKKPIKNYWSFQK